jgi:site-specific recombinase XerD
MPASTSFKVKDLLGHRHVTTTQIYDKRRALHV